MFTILENTIINLSNLKVARIEETPEGFRIGFYYFGNENFFLPCANAADARAKFQYLTDRIRAINFGKSS